MKRLVGVDGCRGGWLVVELALVALETRQSQFGSGSYRVWEVLDGSDWMALGLAGLGVAWGYHPPSELTVAGAAAVAAHFDEVAGHLDTLTAGEARAAS